MINSTPLRSSSSSNLQQPPPASMTPWIHRAKSPTASSGYRNGFPTYFSSPRAPNVYFIIHCTAPCMTTLYQQKHSRSETFGAVVSDTPDCRYRIISTTPLEQAPNHSFPALPQARKRSLTLPTHSRVPQASRATMSSKGRQSPSTSYASFFDSPIWVSPTPPSLSLEEIARINTSTSTITGTTTAKPQHNRPRHSSSTFFQRPRSGVTGATGEKGLAALTRRRSLNLPLNNSFRFGRDKSPAPSSMVEGSRSRLSLILTSLTSDNQVPTQATTQEATQEVASSPTPQTTAPQADPVKPAEAEDQKVVQDLMDNWGGFGDFALDMPAVQTESLDSGDVLAGLEVVVKQVQELEKVEEENETGPDGSSLRASKRISMFDDVVEYIDGELKRIVINNTSGSSSRSSHSRLSRVSASSCSHASCGDSVTSEGQEVSSSSPSTPPKSSLRAVSATAIVTPQTTVAVANAASPKAPSPAAIVPPIIHHPSTIFPSKPAHVPASNSTSDIKKLSAKRFKRPGTASGHEHFRTRRLSADPMGRMRFSTSETNLNSRRETEESKKPVSFGNPKLKAFFSKIKAFKMVWRGKKGKV